MLEVVRKALNSKLVSYEARDGGAIKQVNPMHSCGSWEWETLSTY